LIIDGLSVNSTLEVKLVGLGAMLCDVSDDINKDCDGKKLDVGEFTD
jgi:hypothetical protein